MTQTYIKNHTNTFLIHGHEYTVTAPARFDSATDKLVDDTKLDDQAVEIANAMYRKDLDLVSPDDIKRYRAKVGLSQREFAKLLGWSPNTVALYETGAFPSESNNQLLKALMSDNHLLNNFIQQNEDKQQNKLPSVVVKKVKDYLDTKNDDVVVSKAPQPRYTALQLTNWYRVTNYFDAKSDENIENLTQMKVVKLLYFAFGRYAAKTHGKLFNSPIVAMPYGPVVEEVHQAFNGHRDIISVGLTKRAFDDYNLIQKDSEISDLLTDILNDYGDKTAAGLSKITHQTGSPWSLTGSGVINPTLIAETFIRGAEQ
ncbi:type II TA system antitoxin MqsA family protein [Lentilactobacillus sunkii]|uniref:Toxin-antitoxin system, antitoxin component, Xre domain protein n=1 Tax=Lentilactobacillus sunkii DSM 19904 TaxID=1423808 RepID=A0A0R1KWT5_9LACO|nr:type II TA system antitoxin MqsA family protein [Lentilactobacillus sunkii]KRK88286.1 toxin-antitoxin system, antitoxin component, Xre domain protein [Lentilactobacillus sunkii DSM 19904]